jgi:Rad3-related DNA helicase
MSILDFVPEGVTLRPLQVKILLELESKWSFYKVFVIPASVGSGKSIIAIVVALWQAAIAKSTAIITPKVMLQDQYEETIKNLPSLKGKSRYACNNKEFDHCADHSEVMGFTCEDCPFKKAKAAVISNYYGVFNFQTYMYTKEARKENLIIDEAHSTQEILGDMYTLKLWKHQENYGEINTYGDLAVFLEKCIKEAHAALNGLPETTRDRTINKEKSFLERRIRRFSLVLEGLVKRPTNFLIENKTEPYRGVEAEALVIRPINLKFLPHGLWNAKTNKIILMSATISEQDVEDMGLSALPSYYFAPESPIPPENRPFVIKPVAPMTFKYRTKSLPLIVEAIKELAERHKGEKGVVHCTYFVGSQLKRMLRGPRYIFHTQDAKDKDKAYHDFLARTDDAILVASGMAEGIDLPGDLARWQIITQVVYPSLADKLNVKKKDDRQDWFIWSAIRDLMQRTGRVCRGADDYGVTYVLDSTVRRLLGQARRSKFVPQYFIQAIKIEEKTIDKSSK